ncbi:ribonuclease III [Saxibacter everestensis]|uniref:Ribonuclease 3 n=1 Tax=Saxibacter everestensis TaxID=2909229 RepID=A0ABY8QXV8_9MICO|nr:ribonuclease III [Brevibacteriaceae bacterium ZFBP1038]
MRDLARADDAQLCQRLGVNLDPETLSLALTHRSFAFENGGLPTNERLEFLGDSVLGLVVTSALYNDNPGLPEGQLAKRRSAVVNTRALAGVARRLSIGDHLYLGKGEEATGGRDKDSILADSVEALIGATYNTLGMAAAHDLVHRLIDPLLDNAEKLGAGMDWKTSLQEASSGYGLGVPVYAVEGAGPDHNRVFTATVLLGEDRWGTGSGKSKKEAEAVAAESAINALAAAFGDAAGQDA